MDQAHPKHTVTEDSLASIQLDRLSVEDEAALMNRNRVWQLRGVLVAAVVLGAVGVFWMKTVDTRQSYAAAAAGVQALRAQRMSAFVQCAAPGTPLTQPSSKAQLQAALQSASERLGKNYTRTLLHCVPMLEQLGTELAALPMPGDVTAEAQVLASAAKDLQQTVEGAATIPSYDGKRVLVLLDKVADGMQAYDARQAALEAALRARAK
jgi:hypothetical protein